MNTDRYQKIIHATFRAVPLAGLMLVVFFHAAHYLCNYEIKVVNDEWEYLVSTRALLQGRCTIDYPLYNKLNNRFGGGAIDNFDAMFLQRNAKGELVPLVSIGTLLLLAPALKLFGDHIVYVLPLFLDCCALFAMFFTGKTFFGRLLPGAGGLAGLLYVSSYAVIVNFRPGLRRDLLCASLLTVVSLLVIQAMRRRSRQWAWYGAFFLVSFLTIIKLPYILLYIPLIASYMHTWRTGRQAGHRLKDPVVILLLVAVCALPFFLHNQVTSGNAFIPKQIGQAATFAPKGNLSDYLASNAKTVLKAQAAIYAPAQLPEVFALPVLLIALMGVWFARRDAFVYFWILPAISLFYLFYLFTPRNDFIYNVYLAPTYPLTMLLFAAGIIYPLARLRASGAALCFASFLFVAPFCGIKALRILPGHRQHAFQLRDLRLLRGRIESRVPENALVVCDRFFCYVVDYFTHAQSVSPWMLDGKEGGFRKKIEYLLDSGEPVFFCTYRAVENVDDYLVQCGRYSRMELIESDLCAGMELGGYRETNKEIGLYKLTRKTDR